MISKDIQFSLIHAYVPEHLPDYLGAFSDSTFSRDRDFVYYSSSNNLNIIAYPLTADTALPGFEDHIIELAVKLRPAALKVISPVPLKIIGYKCKKSQRDFYSCLDLSRVRQNAKLRNMLKRSAQVVKVEQGNAFTREHLKLMSEFIKQKGLDRIQEVFFHRLPDYLCQCSRAFMTEARYLKDNTLAGYSIFDPGEGNYGFYLFNIPSSDSRKIPGMNDLLLNCGIKSLIYRGKKFLNMGLGISPGIEQFKAKWGAVPFLPYYYQQFETAFSWKKVFLSGSITCLT